MTPRPRLPLFYGPMFVGFAITGFVARRRNGSMMEALKTGALVGGITLAVFHVASLIRVNLFLEVHRQRADWQDLMSAFDRSGGRDLRTYVNASYLRQTLPKLCAGSILGGVFGWLGGVLNIPMHARTAERP